MAELYFGGDIITMERETDNPEAVLITSGKIVYVGALAEAKRIAAKLKGENLTEIDLKGHTLMPSFIDPHGHISLVAQFSSFCDLSECTTFEEIVHTLMMYKEENTISSDGIILGNGYDHNFLAEQEHPTKQVLDRVSAEIPIYIFHTSGHMGVANSALLELAAVTKETPNPQGGMFGRDAEGNPNGYIEETSAIAKVVTAAYTRIKGDFVQQMLDAQQIYLQNGITTVQDGASGYQTLEGLTAIAKNHLYKIDVISYVMTDDFEKAVEDYGTYFQQYQGRFKIGGAKIVLDGSPQGKSAWLLEPYEGESEYCGYPTHRTDEVIAATEAAVKGRYQLLAHCNGDAASEQFISSYAHAVKGAERMGESIEEIMDLRPVMIHCQTVREEQLDRMKELNMIPSIFVAHTYYWGDVHLKNLGAVRGARISPVKSALDRGLVYNFHQDPPVLQPNIMQTVWCAVNRQTRSGRPIGPEQCIGVYDALKGVTINGAYAYHEEEQKGSLSVGKLADMVVLDQNPLKIDKMQIRGIRVLETLKEGESVWVGDVV